MRVRCSGSFDLPFADALRRFTPEGERAWVEDWSPTYADDARDEVGAVWWTEHSGHRTLWVTVDRSPQHVRYARVTPDVSAGTVTVDTEESPSGGTTVTVSYDLSALPDSAGTGLREFADGFDAMLEDWQRLVIAAESSR